MASRPVEDGEEVRLTFRQSLWGSLVEEDFHITEDGFELVRLRYGELRLAEFYGHEAPRREGDWWVVEGNRRRLASLTLRASAESRLRVSIGSARIPLWRLAASGSPVRLSVAACGDGATTGKEPTHARRGH